MSQIATKLSARNAYEEMQFDVGRLLIFHTMKLAGFQNECPSRKSDALLPRQLRRE